MKISFLTVGAVLSTALLCTASVSNASASPLDLHEAWRMALDHDPRLRAEQARRDADVEIRTQARAQLLPQLGLQAYREDARSDGERFGITPGGTLGIVSTRTDTDATSVGVQLRQPIVAVDRWVALRQATDLRDAAELGFDFARESLLLRVAQAYFGVLAAEDGVRVAEAHVAAVRRFRTQIGHRYEAGVVADTDVQEAQAALDLAEADLIDARHEVELARRSLADLTGRMPDALRPVSAALPVAMPDPADPEWWFARARSDATPVRLAMLGESVARREIERRRAASWPTLDFVATRGRLDRSSSNPFETLDVDSTMFRLELNVPLFTGGAIQSRVRQATAEQREAIYRLEEVRLMTVSQAQRSWLGVDTAIQRIQAREQALRSATAARRSAEVGVVEGVRTTLDVLDAQRQYSRAEAALAVARYEYVLQVLALRAATGLLDDAAVVAVNAWLER